MMLMNPDKRNLQVVSGSVIQMFLNVPFSLFYIWVQSLQLSIDWWLINTSNFKYFKISRINFVFNWIYRLKKGWGASLNKSYGASSEFNWCSKRNTNIRDWIFKTKLGSTKHHSLRWNQILQIFCLYLNQKKKIPSTCSNWVPAACLLMRNMQLNVMFASICQLQVLNKFCNAHCLFVQTASYDSLFFSFFFFFFSNPELDKHPKKWMDVRTEINLAKNVTDLAFHKHTIYQFRR